MSVEQGAYTALNTTLQISGYTCSCGAYVPYGQQHACLWPTYQWQQYPNYWNWSTNVPTVSKFKGSVKSLDKLPKAAAVGDAYYVEDVSILAVRQSGGWFHFDKS